MAIKSSLYNIRAKLLELSQGDFVQERKLANQYFKSFQDLRDLYAVSLINQDKRLLFFVYEKYKPTLQLLDLSELAKEIQATLDHVKQLNSGVSVDKSATKVKNCCDQLIRQLQLHYTWLN
ncbi:hypothetical protein PZB74_06595 [Porifericola rhodea]|uniref:hypothetical protein n=1 Tax=Porifericola rhodea TaxID=930972 RepID=UPI0026671867|nr:hypothetical protein [Porifericola rhodea]WKN33011.1 hypothetical protein PZB74_06595 [Porifericola rhodea]